MSQQFSFLSWVQNNLVSHSVVDPDFLRPVVPVRLNLQVQGGGSPTDSVEEPVSIHGPGDVIGLQPEAVLKTTPPAGEQQYSSLLVASIEFLEEDLPWRYSPVLTGGQAGQRSPWCFLLTVREDEFTALPQGNAPLPSIKVKDLSVFPDAEQTWLWAHVQVNKELTNTSPLVSTSTAQNFLDTDLKQDPDQAFSRLLSPRKLEPSSTYHSFLIPAYETGRLSGLGLPVPDAPTTTLRAETSAWEGTGSKDFPVYYQWSFRTGEAGDFETLARRIQAQPIRDFGSQDMAIITPLVVPPGASVTRVERVVKLPGIIQPLTAGTPPIPNSDIAANLQAEVNQAFFPTTPGSGPYRKPVVAPPAYGRAYVARPAGTLSTTATTWFPQLNLNPSYRALAAVGANIIQDNQEEYMQQAWEQVRDVITANMNLRGMQSGLQTTTSLRTSHLPLTGSATAISANRTSTAAKSTTTTSQQSFSGGSDLPPDDGADQDEALLAVGGGGSTSVDMENYGLHLTGLAFTRVLNPTTGLTLQETVRQSRMPLAAFSPTFRRIMKPFGRYQVAQAGRPLRPTQVQGATYPSTLLEPGLSLKQRDSLLALMAAYDPTNPNAGGITGAQPKERTMRGYQFDDKVVNDVLSGEVGKLTDFWYLKGATYQSVPVSKDTEQPSGKFPIAFASFSKARFTADESVKPALDLRILKQQLIQSTRPGPVYLARANRALRMLPHYRVYTAGAISANPQMAARGTTSLTTANSAASAAPLLQQVQPIMAYPVFKEPMSEKLRQRHPELFMPKIGDFPANVVTLLSHNHAFIEAYMVGLNHAFGSELLWREYPADLQGTYFRQFWDPSEKINTSGTNQNSPVNLANEEEANRDITPIASWGTNALGANYPALNTPQLTLAVRADLLQRFPNTIICAVPARPDPTPPNALAPNFDDPLLIKYPAQRTMLGQDIVLLGFDLTQAQATANNGYFFVFHERPGEPQFGLDDDSNAPQVPANADSVAWQQLGYLDTPPLTEGVTLPGMLLSASITPLGSIDTSAKWAYALFQKPFMVAIHATQMLIP